jgi:hypothetical protein
LIKVIQEKDVVVIYPIAQMSKVVKQISNLPNCPPFHLSMLLGISGLISGFSKTPCDLPNLDPANPIDTKADALSRKGEVTEIHGTVLPKKPEQCPFLLGGFVCL